MTSRIRDGHTAVYMKDSNSRYVFPLASYDTIVEAWKQGAAFISAEDLYGAPGVIKGAAIESIFYINAEAIEKSSEDVKLSAQEDAIL